MRWKAKPAPHTGDVRTRRWFAIIPTRVGEQWVWLERYAFEQEFGYVMWHYVDGSKRLGW